MCEDNESECKLKYINVRRFSQNVLITIPAKYKNKSITTVSNDFSLDRTIYPGPGFLFDFNISYAQITINWDIDTEVTTIEQTAFEKCTQLDNIVIPESITKIEENAFCNCIDLNIFCEVENKQEGWADNWVDSTCTIYWKNQWSYVDGIPTPKSQ